MKALLCNLSILCAWYLAEYAQFGELQHGRNGDDLAFVLYFILTWALFRRLDRMEHGAKPGEKDSTLFGVGTGFGRNSKKEEDQ